MDKPCRCPEGHKYTEDEAKDLDYVCPCGRTITCDVPATRARSAVRQGPKGRRARSRRGVSADRRKKPS